MKPTIYRITHLWPNKLNAEDRIGSLTVQIKAEVEVDPKQFFALPKRLVSLQDYEALEREARR